MSDHKKKPLTIVMAHAAEHAIIKAPPVIVAGPRTVDYTCGRCGTTLMHAEEGQAYGLQIHCAECGSHNKVEG